MDPLSQAVLGASASQSFTKNNKQLGVALIIGWLSAMAPDLDIFIYSTDDPLLFLEFHRQFTHSLIFIPIGALFCSAIFYLFFHKKISFKEIYLYAFLGYATHGLLDACTSYGTQLFWPFSNERFSWNNVAIIDPLFTIPILILIILAFYKKRALFSMIAFGYALAYLSLGLFQNQRAETALINLAKERGHQPQRIVAKPTFGNLILWKLIYEHQGRYYIDAVKITTKTKIIEGESINKLSLLSDLPWLDTQSIQAQDVERFRWFSDNYLALHPEKNDTVIDVRYSLLPHKLSPLWGIRLTPEHQDKHVDYIITRKLTSDKNNEFIKMLF